MRGKRLFILVAMMLVLGMAVWASGEAEEEVEVAEYDEFDWRRFEGETLNLLLNNNPVGQLLDEYSDEFTELTGIEVDISLYSEQQYRQRHQTVMQAESDEIDVYMSLPSREGMLFEQAEWYEPLDPYIENEGVTSPDYNFDDFGTGVIDNRRINGNLTGIPMNIEGPVLYYRHDILDDHGIDYPFEDLEALRDAAEELDEAESDMVAFASRGLAAAVPYTFSNFLHNFGGNYTDEDGRANLSSSEGVAAIELYGELIREYGAEGAINHSFPQLTSLQTSGESILNFQSSNEFDPIMEEEARETDTSVQVLPPGPEGSTPVVIGWQLSISPFSSMKEAAWYFVQWATSQEMQVALGLEGLAPPRDSVWESDEFQDWLGEQEVRQQWADALSELAGTGSAVLAPQILLQPEAREVIGEAVGNVILGDSTAEEAAESADQQLNELIDRSEMF